MARSLLNDGEVFPVREADLELTITADKDAVYYLSPITVEKYRSIAKSHTRQVINKRLHRKEDEIDREGLQSALLDAAIVKWEGVFDHGKSAPCDLAHKLRLPAEVQASLIDMAQSGQQTPEARADSFREPSGVV